MRKLIINISLIVFTVINIPILNSTYAQSGKAKKAHEAILNIHSIDGKGTTVKIIFPKFKIVYNKEKN